MTLSNKSHSYLTWIYLFLQSELQNYCIDTEGPRSTALDEDIECVQVPDLPYIDLSEYQEQIDNTQ